MAKLLLVEDHKEFAGLVQDWLVAQGHLVDCAATGAEALQILKMRQYDVLILDVNLPGLSGLDVCRTFRRNGGTTPVIVLTGNQTIDDKESGFDAGADDYLTKPFQMRELSARVKALLRRAHGQLQAAAITFGNVSLFPDEHRVTVDGDDITLMPKEFAILHFFMKHPGQVFSAEQLIQRVWATEAEASPETIRSYITRLRTKLKPATTSQSDSSSVSPSIVTVHGVGYKFIES